MDEMNEASHIYSRRQDRSLAGTLLSYFSAGSHKIGRVLGVFSLGGLHFASVANWSYELDTHRRES